MREGFQISQVSDSSWNCVDCQVCSPNNGNDLAPMLVVLGLIGGWLVFRRHRKQVFLRIRRIFGKSAP